MADEIGIPRRHQQYAVARRIAVAARRAALRSAAGAAAAALYSSTKGTYMGPASQGSSRKWSEADMGWSGFVPKATKRYVKRCMRYAIEKKVKDTISIIGNSGLPTTNGRVDEIQTFGITQGTTDSTRTGNSIKPVRLEMRFVAQNTANNLGPLTFRVLVFQDRQTNGAVPAITEVLTTGSGCFGGYNADNVIGRGGRRFKVLRDAFFTINPDAAASTTVTFTRERVWKWVISEKELTPIHFDASAGAITDLVSGGIFVASIVNDPDGVVQATVQLMYIDA